MILRKTNNMKVMIQEILTFDISEENNFFYLDIPVQKLINPKFMVVNNDLYIFLYNFSQCFIIKKLPNDFLEAIPFHTCYIKQKLTLNDSLIKISLI